MCASSPTQHTWNETLKVLWSSAKCPFLSIREKRMALLLLLAPLFGDSLLNFLTWSWVRKIFFQLMAKYIFSFWNMNSNCEPGCHLNTKRLLTKVSNSHLIYLWYCMKMMILLSHQQWEKRSHGLSAHSVCFFSSGVREASGQVHTMWKFEDGCLTMGPLKVVRILGVEGH